MGYLNEAENEQSLNFQRLLAGNLKLYDDRDVFKMIPTRRKYAYELLRYIEDENLKGRLPTFDQAASFLGKYKDWESRSFLIHHGLILTPSIMRLFLEFHSFENRNIVVPKRIENALDPKDFAKIHGSHFLGYSAWRRRFKEADAPRYKRYYVACLQKDGVPVFNTIFSSRYTALATLQDTPLLIKYFPNLIHATKANQA